MTPMARPDEGRLTTLHGIMLFDLKRRQEILRYELLHLMDAIRFRLPIKELGSPVGGSGLALLARVDVAAQELHEELESDMRERIAFSEWWMSKVDIVDQAPTREQHCFRQVWHAKMMTKAALVAERLGELHDRLGLQLERTHSDSPNPILRRRAEQGQIDKYLCEHVKWVHRDLAIASINLSARYPYEEVPSTLYSWQYEASSSQHAFVSHANYKKWRVWATSYEGLAEKRPRKFSSLGLSYWMPERLVLHPIIGHELAHQVLQDLYGKGTPYIRLESQDDQLSRTIRRLYGCAEAWLSARGYSAPQIWPLAREILCDLLAAERYGCAYLHTWMLEVSDSEPLAQMTHDAFGMLRPITDFKEVTPDYIQREVLTPSRALATTLTPELYYRGKVLIAFLRAHQRETETLSQELLQQADGWLERHLDLITGALADGEQLTERNYGREFEYRFAQDLARTITEEHSRFSVLTQGTCASAFVRAARHHWRTDGDKPADICLGRQVMSQAVRKQYVERIKEFRPGVLAGSSADQMRTLHDALWRAEWAVESRVNPAAPTPLQRNQLRALQAIAIDDYLYRTGNPHRLLQAVMAFRSNSVSHSGSDGPTTIAQMKIERLTGHSNTINLHRLERMYHPRWLGALDRAIRLKRGVTLSIAHNATFELSAEEVGFFDPIKLHELDFSQIGLQGAVLHAFHLMSLRPSRGVGSLESLRVKYAVDQPQFVLGRYDALGINEMPDSERDVSSHPTARAVSRLKRLVPVRSRHSAGKSAARFPEALATVMVSLRWDAARIMFASWLAASEIAEGWDVYLSDGWEDVVAVLRPAELNGLPPAIPKALKLIEALNASPLVASTETLMHPDVTKYESRLRFRFVCTRGYNGLMPTTALILQVLQPIAGWSIENICGAKDLQVLVNQPGQARSIYDALHGASEKQGGGRFRVETRVSWVD